MGRAIGDEKVRAHMNVPSLPISRVSRMSASWLLAVLLGVSMAGWSGPSSAQALTRIYLGADRAVVLDIKDRATKVAIANPAIADVQVITPSQLLVIGRGVGVTSLVVFQTGGVKEFDVVVHAAPVGVVAAQPLVGPPHAVQVQRGDRFTEHFFSRDVSQQWVELGSVKVESDPPKPTK
jgi:Flp pilus assembly secretin CpaC